MRVSCGFSPNRAQAESFAGVVAGMAHPPIVEGKDFRPSPLKKQLAIVRASGGVAEDRECAVLVNHRFERPKAFGVSVHARPLPPEGKVRCWKIEGIWCLRMKDIYVVGSLRTTWDSRPSRSLIERAESGSSFIGRHR